MVGIWDIDDLMDEASQDKVIDPICDRMSLSFLSYFFDLNTL